MINRRSFFLRYVQAFGVAFPDIAITCGGAFWGAVLALQAVPDVDTPWWLHLIGISSICLGVLVKTAPLAEKMKPQPPYARLNQPEVGEPQ